MNAETRKGYLEILLDYQFDMLFVRNMGVNHAEFLFVEAWKSLEECPEIRPWFMEMMERTLLGGVVQSGITKRPEGFAPDDFIWFLAHASRWPEFHVLAARLSKDPGDVWITNPLHRSSEMILAALKDDWEDRDFYQTFSWQHP
ncbi:hypothetical protein EV700_0925 [Fluviicoccus keumensis]|uniref:Uncharacterized protein n=1 Tax=Fluviicoccus keumensis TaxID=1435465 RepID=A0A4V2G6A4_9GAMM|nr:hypothetical protein [Fluviicoccus keumensis]RZU47956.1 hypothetical protein EV700_0925 [Fluviicoccus keumensis]